MERHEVDHVDFLNIDTEVMRLGGAAIGGLRSVPARAALRRGDRVADGETDELNALIEDQDYA